MKACIRVYKTETEDGEVFGVKLDVGVQGFKINEAYCETPDHAFFLAKQLEKALKNAGADVEVYEVVGTLFSKSP